MTNVTQTAAGPRGSLTLGPSSHPAAGHAAVGGPPTTEQARQLTQVGGAAEGNYAARQEVWTRVLEFFDRSLRR